MVRTPLAAIVLAVLTGCLSEPRYVAPFQGRTTEAASGWERNYRAYREQLEREQFARSEAENAERDRRNESRPGGSTLILDETDSMKERTRRDAERERADAEAKRRAFEALQPTAEERDAMERRDEEARRRLREEIKPDEERAGREALREAAAARRRSEAMETSSEIAALWRASIKNGDVVTVRALIAVGHPATIADATEAERAGHAKLAQEILAHLTAK